MIGPAGLDALTASGWPALESLDVDGWIVRRSLGVTRRANCALPIGLPQDTAAALERVEQLYRDRDLPALFQISPATRPGHLDDLLSERGYELTAPTLVQTAAVDTVLKRLVNGATVEIFDKPDDAWMDLWWSVDGRGDDAARQTAHRILSSGPARYAAVLQDGEAVAVGRLALADDWGGVYCMAVCPDARRTGHGVAVLHALAQQAAADGVRHLWLQVMTENSAARALYSRAGFTTASTYHYRLRPSGS